MFIYLPNLFAAIPSGHIVMVVFFVAVLFAGLTSLVNLFEAPIATLQDNLHFSRAKAVTTIGIIGVVVALCIQAPMPDSVGLAEKMAQWQMGGRRVAFVIGGSLGLGEAVLARANERLSFSRLTFPHPLMRVILLEQLYRGERINAGERYHK